MTTCVGRMKRVRRAWLAGASKAVVSGWGGRMLKRRRVVYQLESPRGGHRHATAMSCASRLRGRAPALVVAGTAAHGVQNRSANIARCLSDIPLAGSAGDRPRSLNK